MGIIMIIIQYLDNVKGYLVDYWVLLKPGELTEGIRFEELH